MLSHSNLITASAPPSPTPLSTPVQDHHQSTPLHLAAEANHPRIIDILVAHDADVNAFNVRRQLPLHIAVEAG